MARVELVNYLMNIPLSRCISDSHPEAVINTESLHATPALPLSRRDIGM
jgi:hypothetical protein